MKFFTFIIGAAFLCSVVYTKSTKPFQNSGSGELLLNKNDNSLNCAYVFFEEVFTNTMTAINNSTAKMDILNDKFMSCNKTGSIEAQDNCTVNIILDMVKVGEEITFDLIQIGSDLMSEKTREKFIEKCEFDIFALDFQTLGSLLPILIEKMMNMLVI